MRYVGIDYGEKRVGIALSNDGGSFALPHSIILNDDMLKRRVLELCQNENVDTIVLGESLNQAGNENPIMTRIRSFGTLLERAGKKVAYQGELMSSHEAQRIKGSTDMVDASAAAVILQRYLDTH